MKKYILPAVFLILAARSLFAGDISLGPSPWIGNSYDGKMKGAGLEIFYNTSETFSWGMTAGWLRLDYTIEDSEYRIDYLPLAAGFRYHFLKDGFNRNAALIAGTGLIYNVHLATENTGGPDPDMSWKSPVSLYLQFGIKTEKEFSESNYFDFFIQYNKSLNAFGSRDTAEGTTTYYMDLIIISIGAGINISFGG